MIHGLFLCFIIGVGLLWALVHERTCRKRLQKYWSRSCMGREWRRSFPRCSKEDIRTFLELFVDAFAFSSSRRLKFAPTDKVIDVYRALYPPGTLCDSIELECFLMNLEKTYGENLFDNCTPDNTLGDIFEKVRKKL